MWLSELLNSSTSHKCNHEKVDKHRTQSLKTWAPFPIHRWHDTSFRSPKTHYGECHGHLRHYLAPGYVGAERMIPRRVILLRRPRAVITSQMNRRNKTIDDLPWVIRSVLESQLLLIAYAVHDRPSRLVWMENLTTSKRRLEVFLKWLNVSLDIDAESMAKKNATIEAVRWFVWDEDAERLYHHIGERMGYGIPEGSEDVLGAKANWIM